MNTKVLLAAMPTWAERTCVPARPVVLLAYHADQRRQLGLERLVVGEPDGDRVHVEDVVDVLTDGSLSLSYTP